MTSIRQPGSRELAWPDHSPKPSTHSQLSSLLVLVALLVSPLANAQTFLISDGAINTCAGVLYDTGGPGASGYGNNQNFTVVICPDQPGESIFLQWVTANLSTAGNNPIDRIRIWDGDNITAPLIGEYTGTQLQGLNIGVSNSNGSGCLTVQFTSNNTGQGVFAANISCFSPCERPTAAATMGEASPARICIGETLQFDGSGSSAAPGFALTQYNWNFGDGTTGNGPAVSHTFNTPGQYQVVLQVVDNNSCVNANVVDLIVQVSTIPNFSGTSQTQTTCLGATVDLVGSVQGTTWSSEPVFEFGPPIQLPDLQGVPFSSSINFTQFAPGATVQNTSSIASICVNMEHSYIGDLVISATCPNGQNIIFHQQGGAGTFLGVPVDNDNTPNAQGVCWNYCWSPAATNGTWAQNPGGTLAAGTYQSVQPFTNLVGCPLNGTWTITFNDLLGSDNGFVCDWSISFAPSLYPEAAEFTPVPGTSQDSAFWAGPFLTVPDPATPLVAVAQPNAPGTFDYTLTVIDNFGCSYDTTVSVTIDPPVVIDAGANIILCNDPLPMAGQLLANGAPPNCTWVLTLFDSGNNGWGGFIGTANVNVNGTNYTLNAGSLATFNIPITPGQTITISYTAAALGGNNGQNSFNLRDDQGNIVYQSPNGPGNGQLWTGTATCGGSTSPTQFQWSPTTGLTNPTSLTTNVFTTTPTWYYLSAFPVGQPECAVVDSVLVSPDPSLNPGLFNAFTVCASQPTFSLRDSLNGTPDPGGVWTNSAGAVVPDLFNPLTGASGTYTYTITSAAGCVASQQLEITIIPADDPSCCGEVDAGEPAFSCTLSIALNAIPGNTGLGVWTGPPGALFANASAPQTTVTMPPGSGGSHWFYWTEDDGNFCLLVDSVQMTVTDPIQITFATTNAVCFTFCDGTATPTVTGGIPGALTYAWSNGSNAQQGVTGLCAGNYSLTVTDLAGCTGTASFTITEPPLLEIDAIQVVPETCFGECDGSITMVDAQAVEYSYDDGATWTASNVLGDLCVGPFSLRIRSAAGCVGSGTADVTGPEPVVANFNWTPNPTNVNNPAIRFFNTSSGANRYEWDIAGMLQTTVTDPSYRFTDREPGIYEVCLIAYNSNNCSDTICYSVVIEDVTFVYVPNAFTPDGDGVNDAFGISTTTPLASFNMLIFDRWGQVVYETNDFGKPWLGSYRNEGDILPNGVYAYRIQYAIPESAVRKEILGSVTLTR